MKEEKDKQEKLLVKEQMQKIWDQQLLKLKGDNVYVSNDLKNDITIRSS